jgi:hypothetical protein
VEEGSRAFLCGRSSAQRIVRVTFLVFFLATGCSIGRTNTDLDEARRFHAYPLYWVGERFEKWKLDTILGLDGRGQFVTLTYGTCRPQGGEQPSCSPPLQLQVSPLCPHLAVVSASPAWKHRHIRGAPVGRNPDGAPVLLSRGAQVKVYRGEGSDSGVSLRALHALRSLNRVPPVITSEGRIPAPAPGVLAGTRKCAQ